MTTPCSCPYGDECTYGTPKPGPDVCKDNPHGHWFADGQCQYCLKIDDGESRERFDHWDECEYWRRQTCTCECLEIGTPTTLDFYSERT